MATVLIVDDVLDFRILVKQLLSREGHTVKEAASGAEALDLLTQDPSISLMLLDIGLPDIDGFAVMMAVQVIRQDRPELKVAIVTGSRDKENVVRGLKLKVDDYIIKPLDPDLFRQKISRLLNPEQVETTFAEIECDFSASLVDVPISFGFHVNSISESGCRCESLNKFLVGHCFSFHCEKLGKIIDEKEYIFRARVDDSQPLSRTSDRFITQASFVGIPEILLQKIRNFTMTYTKKK